MFESPRHKAPNWFTIVTVVLLVWNMLGVMMYLMQVTMTPEALAQLPHDQRQLIEATPAWATAAFAVAVYGGVLGCVLLLMKRNLAMIFLQLSLAGVLVQMFHAFVMSKAYEVYGPSGMVLPVLIIVIAIFLVALAARARANLWTA